MKRKRRITLEDEETESEDDQVVVVKRRPRNKVRARSLDPCLVKRQVRVAHLARVD